jgi:hypothetical protein
MQVRRGSRLPKRLVEAALGAAVAKALPTAILWASTYRPEDGVGVPPSADRLLLQCSPADERVHGISTRVNRKMLAKFIEQPSLRAWADHAQFILVSAEDLDAAVGERCRLELWAITATDLHGFVDDRGRGTVSAYDLDFLKVSGYARPFGDLLRSFSQDGGLPGSPRAWTISPGGRSDREWNWGFGFNSPTPLGVALDE